jgi:hypothetical protein
MIIHIDMINKIRECFKTNKVLFTKHARDEMEIEEFGEISHEEVYRVSITGKVIEEYPDDEPYPSCLIHGTTGEGRHLHTVCAYSEDEDLVIIVTAYQPDPRRWEDYERRKK